MSQFKGTPGPWLIDHDRANEINRIHAYSDHRIGQRVIADVRFGFDEPVESQQHANARLIAAAPDLLAELSHLRRLVGAFLENGGSIPGIATLNGADAAIAKATGEQS